jgi:hypothetical protein
MNAFYSSGAFGLMASVLVSAAPVRVGAAAQRPLLTCPLENGPGSVERTDQGPVVAGKQLHVPMIGTNRPSNKPEAQWIRS